MKKQKKENRCLHKNKALKIIAVYCTCQVTAIFCNDCGKQLTKEQWEC